MGPSTGATGVERARVNPEAKVILTTRDPQRWYESTRETIYQVSIALRSAPLRWMAAAMTPIRPIPAMVDNIVWGRRGQFNGRFEDREHALAVPARSTASPPVT